ncbi:MAG: hypothetical protein Q7T20_08495 [Saprospiraceae bacterium]|nr:hypothetical protein [Saprospiraceae bacterium]
MRKTLIFIFLAVTSCTNYKTVSFRVGRSTMKYQMNIPKGYKFQGVAGDHEFEKRYWYSDSSVIYFTTFSNTLNYDDIRNQGTYYNRFDAILSDDTLTLSGIDSSGRYWKDKKLQYLTVGYSKIPFNRKKEFEKAISSFRNTIGNKDMPQH